MQSRATLFGHAIHPILIVFPLGLLTTGVIFDAIYLIWGYENIGLAAYWMIVAGTIGGIIASPFGWFDWLSIPNGTRAKSIGLMHGVGNTAVVLLFFGSWWLRTYGISESAQFAAYLFSFAALPLAFVGGWLGGELVERLGVGVDDGANLNAPNSLTEKTAAQKARDTRVNA
jgi:uncharacterized membrane protein